MLFTEEDAPSLKTWIVKRIENTSDADADVLADYVIALLKHDGDLKSVRELCEKEIPDFLTEDPKKFLDDVFEAIAYKSYLPGARPPPPRSAEPKPAPSLPPPALQPSAGSQGPKKRGYDEFGGGSASNGTGVPFENGRTMKQPRWDESAGDAWTGPQNDYSPSMNLPPQVPSFPQFDPNNPMEAMMQMQAAMGLLSQFQAPPPRRGGRNQGRRRGRCRDFDRKGYCSRGVNCQYDHGNEMPAFQPPVDTLHYDFPASDAFPPPDGHGPHRGRDRRRGRGNRKGGGRAAFSAEGPVTDKTKTTIVVESIPEDHFSEESVRGVFSKFGEIVEVSMQPYKHLAIIKYDDWAAANAAYKSPDPIFDNRFVKVFWYKNPEEALPRTASRNGSHSGGAGHRPAGPDPEPEIDMEELAKRQEEAQQKYREREAKRAEIDEKRQALEKQQQELLVKHREASEALKARLSPKEASTGGGAEQLRAQLAALESEAKILGIDPNGTDEAVSVSEYGGGYPPPRGGYRGRARGRGRGRGGRGRASFQGIGDRHAAYAQFSLDLRPRKIAIKGADFTVPEQDEKLRQFLLNMGEFDSVDTEPAVTHISFRDRKTAERVYYSLHGKELGGVEGTLDLSWVSTPLPPAASSIPASGEAEDGATTHDEVEDGEVEGSEDGEMREDDGHEGRGMDMDYDAW